MRQVSGTQPCPVVSPYVQSPAGRLAKFLIGCLYFAGRGLVRLIGRLLGFEPRKDVVAISYHQVPREQRVRFAKQMDHLLRWAAPIRADVSGQLPPGARHVMVTADDAWLSFIENALPELERRNIPVTIFAISGYLGQSLGDPRDRIVTEDELRRLPSELVRIGSHTSTHAYLTALDERAAWLELTDSRRKLEATLKTKTDLFAFPFGAWTDALIRQCRDAGYRRVFLASPCTTPNPLEDFVIGRIRVDPTDWLCEFHLKLTGAYNWLPWAIGLKRRLSSIVRAQPSVQAG